MQPPITICLPCHGRPQRTRRMLNCILAQTLKGFELVMIGDACTDFQDMVNSTWFADWKLKFKARGNQLFYMNLKTNKGGHGAGAMDIGIKVARGKYFCWANNDDMLHPEHLSFYHGAMVKTGEGIDFLCLPTFINGEMGFEVRYPQLKYGSVGHSELVVNTNFLRTMPPYQTGYGHDWVMVQEMMAKGTVKAGLAPFPTYLVMSTPRYQEKDID